MFKVLLPLALLVLVNQAFAHDLCVGQLAGTRLAHPATCEEYIVCGFNRTLYFTECPHGLHFNRFSRNCDIPERAGCQMPSTRAICDCSCCATSCGVCENDITICKGVADNTLLAHPTNCGQYVICKGNCAEVQECPCDELWDSKSKTCKTACEVNCPGSGYPCTSCSNDITVCKGKADGTILVNPNVCGGYVTCKSDCATEGTCKSGQLFNPSTNACGPSCAVDCSGSGYPCASCSNDITVCKGKADGTILVNPNVCGGYVTCKSDCATEGTCKSGQLFNPSTNACGPSCAVDCSGSGYPCTSCSNDITVCKGKADGTILVNPNVCGGYVTCKSDCATEGTCKSGQLFNPSTNACGPSCAVDCSDSGYPCTSCSNDITVCKGKADGTILVNPNVCGGYVTCKSDCATEGTCKSGQLFNPSTNACGPSCAVDCSGSGYPCTSCSNDITVCKGQADGTVLVNPNVCGGYVTCKSDCATEGTCKSGQLFNPSTNACGPSCAVDCSDSGYPCTSCSNDITVCKGKADGTILVNPNVCGGYVTCKSDCATEGTCKSGQLFNPSTNACGPSCAVDCSGSGYPCTSCSNDITVCKGKADGTVLVNPNVCGGYVTCKSDCATEGTCKSGQLFNPSTNACGPSCAVDCSGSGYPCTSCSNDITVCKGQADGTILVNPNVCGGYVTCKSDCATEGTCKSGQLFNPSTNACGPSCAVDCSGSGYPCTSCSNDITVCKGKADGTVLVNPNVCGGYVTCKSDCATEGTCKSGQLFNPSTNACGPSCAVDCSGSGYPCTSCSNGITVCNGQIDGTVLVNPNVCGGYVTCKSDCAIAGTCTSGQLFNPSSKSCGPSCAVNCPGSGYPCQPSTGPSGEVCNSPGVCVNQKDGALFPDASNINGYIVCQCECEIPRPCPKTLVWNNKLHTCDYPSDNNKKDNLNGRSLNDCPNSSTACINQEEGTLLPISGKCDMFYLCSHGCAFEFGCPANLLYNSEAQICDYRENVKCS